MELLSFSLFALWMLQVVSGNFTAPHELEAIQKIIKYWKLNITTDDPCNPNAAWAPKDANPRIACDYTTTPYHITNLKVYALNVVGELPKELFSLTELVDLNLGQNVLSGPIPPAIGNLTKMQYLSLGINNLTGTVPAELGKLTKSISLSFSSNSLHGPLPRELGNLTSLKELYIDSSGVSGKIPQEFSNWKNTLEILWASDNSFTGKIPEFFGSFQKLTDLRLEGTNLEGPIPSSFAALTNLVELRMGDLGGEVESSLDFVKKMTSLSTLSLRSCRITDQIQEKLSSLLNLKVLDLSFNNLTGKIPASFKNFTSLQFLFLGSNSLSGNLTLPSDIISPNAKFLALDVSFNPHLTGNISGVPKTMLINVVGTSIHDPNLDAKAAGMLGCLGPSTNPCTAGNSSDSFSVSSGASRDLVSADDTNFDVDSVKLGAASSYVNVTRKWAVSRFGIFYNNKNGPQQDQAHIDSQISETTDSELYKDARISPNSLRYYGLGMKNGMYQVDLHFAEIQMISDSPTVSWQNLARRVFDVCIQGKIVMKDFNIEKEAGGTKRALVKTFNTSVTNTVMDILLLWKGKGTCCIPVQSTYGPLISAVSVKFIK